MKRLFAVVLAGAILASPAFAGSAGKKGASAPVRPVMAQRYSSGAMDGTSLAIFADFLNAQAAGIGFTNRNMDVAFFYTSDTDRFGVTGANDRSYTLLVQGKSRLSRNTSLVYGAEGGYLAGNNSGEYTGWAVSAVLGVQYDLDPRLSLRLVTFPYTYGRQDYASGTVVQASSWFETATAGIIVKL